MRSRARCTYCAAQGAEGSEDVEPEPESTTEGAPESSVPEADEDPSDVMDLRTVLGPKIPKLPPPPTWKK